MKFRITVPSKSLPRMILQAIESMGGTVQGPVEEHDIEVPDDSFNGSRDEARDYFLERIPGAVFVEYDPTDKPGIQLDGEDGKGHKITVGSDGKIESRDRAQRGR